MLLPQRHRSGNTDYFVPGDEGGINHFFTSPPLEITLLIQTLIGRHESPLSYDVPLRFRVGCWAMLQCAGTKCSDQTGWVPHPIQCFHKFTSSHAHPPRDVVSSISSVFNFYRLLNVTRFLTRESGNGSLAGEGIAGNIIMNLAAGDTEFCQGRKMFTTLF